MTNKEQRYYLAEDELTIKDRQVFCHGDGPIFSDDSLCRFENKGRAKHVLTLLNSTERGEADHRELLAEINHWEEEYILKLPPETDLETLAGNILGKCRTALQNTSKPTGESGGVKCSKCGSEVNALYECRQCIAEKGAADYPSSDSQIEEVKTIHSMEEYFRTYFPKDWQRRYGEHLIRQAEKGEQENEA
jgi:hypothetical protein